jgi:predicted porin
MKKSLIALAALATVATGAQAQSSVEIYGILSTGYESMKLSGSDGSEIKQTTTGRQGAQSGSRLGFRGTEDLGGGTKAGFVYELGVDMSTGIAANPRLAYLDLNNSTFGTLRAGRVDSLTRQAVNTYTSHGNSGFEAGNTAASMGRVSALVATRDNAYLNTLSRTNGTINGFNGATSTVASTTPTLANSQAAIAANAADIALLSWGQAAGRTSNTIGYISPSIGGVQFHAQVGKVESDTSAVANKTVAQDTQAYGLSYNAGALSLMAATSTEKSKSVELGGSTNAGNVKAKTDIFGASYDFQVAKAFAIYTDREIKRDNATLNAGIDNGFSGAFGTADGTTHKAGAANFNLDQKDTTVGVSVPLGNVVLVGSYSTGDIKFEGDANTLDMDGYQLQANYLFSKRTKAYVMYGQTKLKSVDNTDKLKGYVAGIQHSF